MVETFTVVTAVAIAGCLSSICAKTFIATLSEGFLITVLLQVFFLFNLSYDVSYGIGSTPLHSTYRAGH